MRRILFLIAVMAMVIASAAARGQIRLPSVPLPMPNLGGLPDVRNSIRNTGNTDINIDTGKLVEIRINRQRELIRKYPDFIEMDVAGAPVVRGQLVAIGPSAGALAAIIAAGFAIDGERELAGLDTKVVILRPPANLSLANALARLQEIDPAGTYDYNHIYSDSGTVAGAQNTSQSTFQSMVNTPQSVASDTPARNDLIKIGLIDGGVDRAHPALQNAIIRQWGCAGKKVASAHGNAVASIMVGQTGKFKGVLSTAVLYAADVYCNAPTGGAVDAIVDALAWMARERVAVINLSLVGPPNQTLERILNILNARGHIVVAAVGNDGPTSPPLYPAAYAGVIAVTAVDARQRVLPEACRGSHIAFSAPGSDMLAAGVAADDAGHLSAVRGTSFAAPIVAAMLARALPVPDRATATRAIAALANEAIDLGASGRDPVFGYGVVGMAYRNPT